MAKYTNPYDFKVEPILPTDVKRATIVAFFAWVFAVYDFILFGTLLPEIGAHYKWDPAEQAAIATWVAAGTALIAFVIGPILDKARGVSDLHLLGDRAGGREAHRAKMAAACRLRGARRRSGVSSRVRVAAFDHCVLGRDDAVRNRAGNQLPGVIG